MKKSIDIIGDIAIITFPEKNWFLYKKFFSWNYLRKNKKIQTVLEKKGAIKGKLRKFDTGFLSGKNKKETIHTENGCKFYLHIDKTYFSPRLSNERKTTAEEIAENLKQNSNILVMFAGIAPFPIVLAKELKRKRLKARVVSSELNKQACKYAEKNITLNKVQDYVEVFQGDSRNLKIKDKFDVILMTRPNLKETFLDSALKFSKKGTLIYYHGFGTEQEVLKQVENKKVKLVSIRKAGDIAPRKWRWLVKLVVKKK